MTNRLPTAMPIAFLLLLFAGSGAMLSQVAELTPEDSELAERVADRFEVLLLSDGVLLESRHGSRLKAIEVSSGKIAVDGKRIDERSEVFELLGDDARLVVALSGLEKGRLRALFGESQFTEDRPPEAAEVETSAQLSPDAPVAPAAPSLSSLPSDRQIPIRIGDVEVGSASISSDAKVVVGGKLQVEENDRYRDVVVLGGQLEVEGEVRGDASVFGGSAWIDGRVTGDVVAIGGSVELGENADVEGDVTSVGGEVERASGARVGGRISELSMLGPVLDLDHLESFFGDRDRSWDRSWIHFGRVWSRIWHLMGLAFLAFMACVVRVVAPNGVDRIDRAAEIEPWKAAFVGFAAVMLFLPLLLTLAVVLTISIIGIPLLLLLPFVCLGFVLAGFVGFVGIAQRLGRWAETRFELEIGPFGAILAGVAMVYVWGFLGSLLGLGGWPITFFAVMLTAFGWLIQVAAWSVGLGAVVLSRFGTDQGPLVSRSYPPPVPGMDLSPAVADEVEEVDEGDDLDLSDLELPKPDDNP